MSQPMHTPGPWNVEACSEVPLRYVRDGKAYFHQMYWVRAGRVLIAPISRSVDGENPNAASNESNADSWAATDANARLIGAAPELLEACRAAHEWLSGWASAEPYIGVIERAIAKATGEVTPP